MTEVKTYRCNRCDKKFTKDINEQPSEMQYRDRDVIPSEDWQEWDLCEACIGYLHSWITHDKDYDRFDDSMQKKWEEET